MSYQAIKELIADVFRLQTEVTRLRASVDRLGGPRDTVELRHKARKQSTQVGADITRLQEDAKGIKERLKHEHSEHKSVQTTKILSNFETVLKDLQAAMKLARNKEAASLPRRPEDDAVAAAAAAAAAQEAAERGHAREGDVERQALLQKQRQVEAAVLEGEMTYNEALIEEREQGINEIAQQIGEVNEIFQDLAVLVNDQGMMLDDIESNITRTADRTAEAGTQLRAAERSQRGSRNKMCFILLVVGAILAVIVFVSVLTR